MSQNKPKATFIIHGNKGNIKKLQNEILSVLSDVVDIEIKFTPKEGAKEIAKLASQQERDIIVICGGDGSINETINGYIASGTKKDILFGVLPIGTGNDFVKTLKTAVTIGEMKQLITKNSFTEIDVFNMGFNNKNKERANRFYVNIADIGIGGFVAEMLENSSRVFGANFTYVLAIAKSFITYKKQRIKFTSPEFKWEGPVMSLCMANGQFFGSGLGIAPNASLTDGKLQLTIIGDVSLWDYVKNLSNVTKSRHIEHSEVFYKEAASCKIEALENECPIDMDGEFIGYTPIEVKLHDRKVRFLSY
jgi:diacylglycerol kinase (ATP)